MAAPGVEIRDDLVALPDLNMHVVSAGPEDGAPVVLLHGFPEFWYSWRFQIDALAHAGYRVIAPDQRGYNLSDKHGPYDVSTLVNDVVHLQEALGLASSHVVGHDWGAVIAWSMAATRPDRVQRLAILNGPHPNAYVETLRRYPKQLAMSWYIGLFQIPAVAERFMAADDFRVVEKLFRKIPDRYMRSEDVEKYKDALRKDGAVSAALGWYREIPKRLFSGGLALSNPHISSDTLVIWGQRDEALAEQCNEPLSCYVPRLTLRYIPNGGHWVHMDHPDEVNRLLLEFLARPSQAEGKDSAQV